MRKADIETYWTRRDGRVPSIDVKVRDAWNWARMARQVALDDGASAAEADAFAAWCDEHEEDETLAWLFDAACEDGRETIATDAAEVFGDRVAVEYEGRSGGHLIVRGLPDLDEWDAIAVARWAKFARYVAANVANVPYAMAWQAWANPYAAEQDERDAELAMIVGAM